MQAASAIFGGFFSDPFPALEAASCATIRKAMAAQSPARPGKPVAHPSPDRRLRKHADYQRVYREGKRQSLPLMTYFYACRRPQAAIGEPNFSQDSESGSNSLLPGPRVGLTAGRVLGNAVERNRIKRRMRHAIRHAQAELTASVDVILHPRRTVLEANFCQIERDVKRAFLSVQAAMQASGQANTSHGR